METKVKMGSTRDGLILALCAVVGSLLVLLLAYVAGEDMSVLFAPVGLIAVALGFGVGGFMSIIRIKVVYHFVLGEKSLVIKLSRFSLHEIPYEDIVSIETDAQNQTEIKYVYRAKRKVSVRARFVAENQVEFCEQLKLRTLCEG
ncbi:MAG: hypothetical protein FWH20_06400 [Oscillospiraceae bacterium]|nr:hypothetical protein [Oscillospiraceae bacterium]